MPRPTTAYVETHLQGAPDILRLSGTTTINFGDLVRENTDTARMIPNATANDPRIVGFAMFSSNAQNQTIVLRRSGVVTATAQGNITAGDLLQGSGTVGRVERLNADAAATPSDDVPAGGPWNVVGRAREGATVGQQFDVDVFLARIYGALP